MIAVNDCTVYAGCDCASIFWFCLFECYEWLNLYRALKQNDTKKYKIYRDQQSKKHSFGKLNINSLSNNKSIHSYSIDDNLRTQINYDTHSVTRTEGFSMTVLSSLSSSSASSSTAQPPLHMGLPSPQTHSLDGYFIIVN